MRRAAAVAAALALLAAGCGGGDEQGQGSTSGGPQTAARTSTEPATDAAPGKGESTTTTEAAKPKERQKGESPESRPGGAGDEEPARSQALLTGRHGAIAPRVVQVPPFIAIRVELRSADGGRYALRIGGGELAVGGPVAARSITLAGLRPGRSYRGRGPSGSVRIEATAEPGP